tara:strand:+ start:2299 stop:3378 length:1080 start_codon:yes stop_codon:yes gene_type:complete
MAKEKRTILITGGAGFIGSHLVRHWLRNHPQDIVLNLDALTYAGNLANTEDFKGYVNYHFVQGSITDEHLINQLFQRYQFNWVFNLAAESHVDRSIHDPLSFVQTNVLGTTVLLQACVRHWSLSDQNIPSKKHLFYQISTDEVYGSLSAGAYFTEASNYAPNSPYSATKAAADHLVRSYYNTYNLPVVISNCSNNFGPFQFPEKLIPLMVLNAVEEKKLPVYGDGRQMRDWLFVTEHCQAIDVIAHKGKLGETYLVGGKNEYHNIDLVNLIAEIIDEKLERKKGTTAALIEFVQDRPGHDVRYAIDASKIERELGFSPSQNFEVKLKETVDWYLANSQWIKDVISGEYRRFYQLNYGTN